LRVAVVHDWLTGMRGGEHVLEAILESLPQAEIFSLFHFRGSVSPEIESHRITTSFLQPAATRLTDYRRLLPFFPAAARSWDFRGFDLIVSSSHCVAKGVRARGIPHLCYCHTPMRYVWDRFDDYFPRGATRAIAKPIAAWLRRWDVRTSDEVTRFVANSQFVRSRIERYYRREADVVHPFVHDSFLDAPLVDDAGRNDEHVIVSALVPYKNVELAIEAFAGTDRRLVVIGGGPLLDRLRARRVPNVSLLGRVSRDVILERLARARTLILPGVEDFGITPLEAMALGTPVVALGAGGVLDSVQDGVTGIFFAESNVHSLRQALQEAESRTWDRAAIRAHAAGFSRARFLQQFRGALERIGERR
jgi:glycosyltransferase involved in cell wall biosynthesis